MNAFKVPMRRGDRAVTELPAIREILMQCKTCHVALVDGDMPYVVPLSFGFELTGDALTLYFHSAKTGRKLDVMRNNSRAAFSIALEGETVFLPERPCNSSTYFASVLGSGTIAVIEDAAEKCRALSLMMERQTGAAVAFAAEQADAVCVLKLVSHDFTAKRKAKARAESPTG